MIILCIWIALLFIVIYGTLFAVGSSFGGAVAGFSLCVAFTLQIAFWGGVITLIYYSLKEIGKHL